MTILRIALSLMALLASTVPTIAQEAEWKGLNDQAVNLYKQGQWQHGIEVADRALKVAEKTFGDQDPKTVTALNTLGDLLYKCPGRYAESEPYFRRALTLLELRLGKDHPQVASQLQKIALLYLFLGRYEESEPLYKRSLEILEQKLGKDHHLVGTALNSLAMCYSYRGRYGECGPLYKRSLEILEQILGKDNPSVSAVLNNLAKHYLAMGRYSESEKLFNRSVEIGKKLGMEDPTMATWLNNQSELYVAMGRYAESEILFKRALQICELKLGKDDAYVASCLGYLARVYGAQGMFSQAEQLYRRQLDIRERQLGNCHPFVAGALSDLGWIYKSAGRHKEAEPLYKRALEINEQAFGKDHGTSHSSRNTIALFYIEQGLLQQAEPLVKQLETRWRGYNSVGLWYLRSLDYNRAKDSYNRLLINAQRSGNVDNLFLAHTGLGEAFEGLEEYEKASEHYRKAIQVTEQVRSQAGTNQRDTFLSVRIGGFLRTTPYEGLARVLMKLNKPEEALTISEYCKARAFSESLAWKRDLKVVDVPPEILDKDLRIRYGLAAMRKNLQDAREKDRKESVPYFETEAKKLEADFEAHKKLLREKYPVFAATRYPEPMTLAQTPLRDDEWVIAYHVTDSCLIIYMTKGKGIVKALTKEISRKGIDELIRRLRTPLEEAAKAQNIEEQMNALRSFDLISGKKLSDILIGDILRDLPAEAPLIVVPDDSLGVLPFEMLPLNSGGKMVQKKKRGLPCTAEVQFLGDRNQISYYQSLTALTLTRTFSKVRISGHKRLVMADPIFGPDDPRLTGVSHEETIKLMGRTMDKIMAAKQELNKGWERLEYTAELGRFLKELSPENTEVFMGKEATKQRLFTSELQDYGTLVFATHGDAAMDLPGIQEPVLVLTLWDQPEGQDGFLRLSEVMGLKLNTELAALTACQSGLGRRISGEGVMGMGRAFQYAGAKCVLMSLWSVPESSSVELVQNFFRHMKEGRGKLEALNLARKELRDAGYDHPIFWAPFILVGEVN